MKYLDPVASIIGAVSAGVSVAVGLPVPVALGIGVVALAIADVGRIRSSWRSTELTVRAPAVPSEGSLHPDEGNWIRRAADAATAIRRSVGFVDPGPLKDRLGDVADDAERVLSDLAGSRDRFPRRGPRAARSTSRSSPLIWIVSWRRCS